GRSAKRVASSRDYNYLLEDIARIKDEREENRISLNREERVADLDARQVRRKTRNDERRVRFAKTEERDGEQFRLFELTLDKVKAEELREIGPDNERTIYTRRVTEALDGANEALKWPSGIGPAKRESIAIAMDLIELTQASRVARKTPKA
ncbi:MAG: carboxy terminal-processing peptidase, partial [Akkermansiaceae bacterium]